MSILTLIIAAPILAALLVTVIPRQFGFGIRLVSLIATLASMLLAMLAFAQFPTGSAEYHFVQRIAWVESVEPLTPVSPMSDLLLPSMFRAARCWVLLMNSCAVPEVWIDRR